MLMPEAPAAVRLFLCSSPASFVSFPYHRRPKQWQLYRRPILAMSAQVNCSIHPAFQIVHLQRHAKQHNGD